VIKDIPPGTQVTLRVPGSPLDGTGAVVERAEGWGAHVLAPAAATGRYRAGWDEMEVGYRVPPPSTNGVHREVRDSGFDVLAKEQGYSGDVCGKCGGTRLRRTGACTTCEDCFESGCS
jgi:hypothetical protein